MPLHLGENVIGRSRSYDVTIPSTSVSRRHACVFVQPDAARVEDLGSKNGTFVNGRRVDGLVAVSDGDTLRVGTVTLAFRVIAPEAPTRTSREQP